MNDNKTFLNKYRPVYFDEYGPHDKTVTLLKKIMDRNIMLMGNIGTGKTTYLNTIIHEYYKSCDTTVVSDNILHINSLKEQGINYYRNELKTFCQTSSSIRHKKKIVVLDDLDFINEQSQQVFRNLIDKYSNSVYFIASCSNSQKVIESIQSRLIIVKLPPYDSTYVEAIANNIITREKILIDPDAKQYLLSISNFIPKIVINYLEKIKLMNARINLNVAKQICTDISFVFFEEYFHLLKKGQLKNASTVLYDIYDKGYSVMDLLDNMFIFVKFTDILDENEKYKIIPIICEYISIFSNIHEHEIEIFLVTFDIYINIVMN